ncbi:HD domain-containing protein [Nocardiopsis sp. NPDC006139]|uniref:HD domain-containing protein n=1 Tax=Nocardiopsis sp. NPDC006139 TaxID=3154578 RepID=UPI0033B2A394
MGRRSGRARGSGPADRGPGRSSRWGPPCGSIGPRIGSEYLDVKILRPWPRPGKGSAIIPRPLPARAEELFDELRAPARLYAHCLLVHDTAAALLDRLLAEYRGLPVDSDAVLFGAAVHDIGKTAHPEELTGPGRRHEAAGRRLLLDRGVPEGLARFCATHGDWEAEDRTLEDLLVTLADKVWKGARLGDLETLVARRIGAAADLAAWEVFAFLDDHLTALADDADRRLAYQNSHPLTPRPGGTP